MTWSTRNRISFAAVLAATMTSVTFAAVSLGVIAPFLLDDPGLTRTQIGTIAMAFTLTSSLAAPGAGRLTDWIGGRSALVVFLLISIVGLLAMGTAPTYPLLVAAAVFAGLAQAGGNPATNKLIAARVEPGRRGVITGIKQSGVQAGLFISGLVMPSAALALGWRPSLMLAVLIPGLTIPLALATIPASRPGRQERLASRTSLPRDLWWLVGYGLLAGLAVAGLGTYLPLFGHEAVGLSVTTAGLVAGVSGLAGVIGRLLWSWLGEKAEHFSTPLILIAGLGTLASVLVLISPTLGVASLWLGALIFGASISSWTAYGMVAVMAVAGEIQAGRASGLVFMGFGMGMGLGPPLFGLSVDSTDGYLLGILGVIVVQIAALALVAAWRMVASRAGEVRV